MKTTEGLELRSIARAARELDVDRKTVYRWLEAGYLRSVKVGTRTYISAEEIVRVTREGGLFHS